MKKLIYFLMSAIALLLVVSCSSSNTPSGAMKTYLSAVESGDYEKFVDGIHMKNVKPDDMAETKEGMTAMLKEKASKDLEKRGGLKSFEILSEEISEDGNTAVVEFKQVYGNGDEVNSEQKMVKVDGKWLMDISK